MEAADGVEILVWFAKPNLASGLDFGRLGRDDAGVRIG